ncbi:S-adenosyl-L-methionine-dependent methyltransferase [Thozetella sp. PMI_491]|nr:S-adenosyl-L-methionine-dependent methyltransferase [Thozetella sp. PMI_491]
MTAGSDSIDTLAEQLRVAAAESEEARSKTLDVLRELQLQLESRHDIYNRIAFSQFELAVARVAEDLKLYQILDASDQPLEVAELASKTGAAPLLLRRMLRYLASIGQIQETGRDAYAANTLTKTLAQPGYAGVVYHFFDNVGPALQVFPNFLAENQYRDIDNAAKTPAQKAFSTDLPMFAWLPTRPERFEPLQKTMAVQPQGQVPWFSVFPFESQVGTFAGPDVLVDVGGGLGHQCAGLLRGLPELELRGRLVLQDLPQTLKQVPPLDGVRITAHDFFQPQPVRGARFYYLRNILHDWPDDQALIIISHLRDALGPDSQILIDEIVMPDTGAHWHTTSMDFIMMTCLGSRERTVADWHALLEAAGLRILQIHTYLPRREDSIIQVVKA